MSSDISIYSFFYSRELSFLYFVGKYDDANDELDKCEDGFGIEEVAS